MPAVGVRAERKGRQTTKGTKDKLRGEQTKVMAAVNTQHTGREKSKEARGAVQFLRSPSLRLDELREGSGSSGPAITISFIKKKHFKSNLKSRDDASIHKSSWELVTQERSLIADGTSTSIVLLQTLGLITINDWLLLGKCYA